MPTPGRARARLLALLVGLTASSAACSFHQDSAPVPVIDPGRCVPVDIAAAPETAPLLTDIATRFNGSATARLPGAGCAFVRVQNVDSPVALRELATNGAGPANGPAPVAWVPGSTMWGELLNARLAEQHRPAMAPDGSPFARTPLVIAMPLPMARALGYPGRPIGWPELEQLAANRRGWAAYGHPEWGSFRLGKGNPNWSTTGLDQTVALDASAAAGNARLLEQSVAYYSDSSDTYLDNWRRIAMKSPARALTYLSAVITDERSVVTYNAGHAQQDGTTAGTAARPKLPLAMIYPADAAIESDNPIIVLRAPWSSASARAGAQLFARFALLPAGQAKVAAAGFRPARGAVDPALLNVANGVDLDAKTDSVAPSSPAEVTHALAHWATNRRPGRVLVLFDVSDSMADAANSTGQGPSKMVVARAALTGALAQLAPGDDIGLRIFTTKLANPVSPNWLDVVPTGPYSARRRALERAIAALRPEQGSPLYAATRGAADSVAAGADPQRINGVVLLTDGYNEDQHDNNLAALLAHLAGHPDVPVFTIDYSTQADVASLTKMAQVTNAWNYDASATKDLADRLARALASF